MDRYNQIKKSDWFIKTYTDKSFGENINVMIENLILKRPLCVLDTETTGLDPKKDKIIEICVKKINPDKSVEVFETFFNPSPIKSSEEAFKIHKISDESLLDQPTFADKAKELHAFLKDCDLCGYNVIRFDLQFLMNEFYRCGIVFNYKKVKIIDVKNIYTKTLKPGTLEFALKYLTGEKAVDNHRANKDVDYTIQVLDAHKDYIEDFNIDTLHNLSVSNNSFDMSEWIIKDGNNFILNFGKSRGKNIFDVFENDMSYIDWLLSADTTPIDTKIAIKGLLIYHQKQNGK